MKIIIGSLQYSPTYKSLCCALGKQCEKFGHSVIYLFSKEYKWMLSDDLIAKTIFIGNSKNIISAAVDGLNYRNQQKIRSIILKENPDFIYMHNFHPILNYYIAKIVKKLNCTFIQHVHEPFVEKKNVYGGLKQYWLYLFEYAQEKLLEKTDIAILSSDRALQLFKKRYQNFSGKKIQIPLIYEDSECNLMVSNNRKFITFIGPPVEAKGPETFLEIMEYSENNKLNLSFMLISRAKIMDPRYYGKKNLTLFYKEKISDEEIGDIIKQSIMTITPYKVATQSSVILVSNMYGTPVISNNVGGLSETVHHLETGYLIDNNATIEEWVSGIDFIKDNLDVMTVNCRNHFVKEFSEINWPRYFKDLWC